ncbi:tubulin delta chain-like [Amphiura filiformis]|uniref:tubulin delta chain-like n=1 Tax=Amphiura filiformis TaxID=82378 RepID=UPI003B211F28
MSVVTLQLGQCGNQVGLKLFQTLASDLQNENLPKSKNNQEYVEESLQRFFHRNDSGGGMTARAVSVDMETKVIQNTVTEAKKSAKWRYPIGQQFCKKRGAGNNWADGFYSHGADTVEPVMEMIQKEVEKCDALGGFLALMSVAGGTGSGVGTCVSQALRDEYPHTVLMNQLIWPHSSGEVILQNYNTILSLAHLYQCSDAILLIQNDHIRTICSRITNQPNVSLDNMNQIIAHHTASALQPALNSKSHWQTFGDIMKQLVPHADYKLLTLRNVPQVSQESLAFSSYNWPSVLKRLRQMLITGVVIEEGMNWHVKVPTSHQATPHPAFSRSLANILTLRGKESSIADTSSFSDANMYPDWIPGDMALTVCTQNREFCRHEKTATLLGNCQAPVTSLDTVVHKAWNMFAMRAYVHWYTRYGMAEEEFIDSFACLEQVVHNYKNL